MMMIHKSITRVKANLELNENIVGPIDAKNVEQLKSVCLEWT